MSDGAATAARAAATWLQEQIAWHASTFGIGAARWLCGVVANPRTSSDTLLILADRLREAAREYELVQRRDRGHTFRTVADLVAELAPQRATPPHRSKRRHPFGLGQPPRARIGDTRAGPLLDAQKWQEFPKVDETFKRIGETA